MKIKAIIVAFLSAIVAIFAAFKKGEKTKENEIKAESEAMAREVERANVDVMVEGLEREQVKQNEKVNTVKRDHFS